MANYKGRANLVSVITTPLGFFALALLIVEGFLGIILIGSNLEAWQKFIGLLIGAGLFLVIVFIVTLLVVFKQENLLLGEDNYIKKLATKGDSNNQFTDEQLEITPKVISSEQQIIERKT